MDEETKVENVEKTIEAESYLKVTFSSPTSIEFGFEVNNISPLQLLALSQYFEFLGKSQLSAMQYEMQQKAMQEQMRNRIARPGELTPRDATTLKSTLSK